MRADQRRKHERLNFGHVARCASNLLGSAWAFAAASACVIVWALMGPIFKYSEGWQLVINTGTTIVTFLMVFLIQNTQNRDARALHLKLDELIRSLRAARNSLIDLENCSDEEVEAVARQFEDLKRNRAATGEASHG